MKIHSLLTPVFAEEKWIRIGFFLALAIITAVAGIAYHSIVDLEKRDDLVNNSHEVQTQIAALDATYGRVRNSWRAYIAMGDDTAYQAFKSASRELPDRITSLELGVAANPLQLSRITTARNVIIPELETLNRSVARKSAGELQNNADILAELNTRRAAPRTVNLLIEQLNTEERLRLAERERESDRGAALAKTVIIVGSLLSCILLAVSYWLLLRQIRRRDAANKDLEGFSYSVSHDLRAPLRAIGGYARMLEEDYAPRLDEEGKRYLGVVRAEAIRMGTLVDDLLAFSGLGRARITASRIDMTALAQEVAEELGLPAGTATTVDVERLPLINGDRGLLRQVWANLIGNAIKYSSTRPQPRVRISGKKERGETVYRVEDNGVGFDMRHRNKLFGVFERLHSATEFPGSGIGLAIVRRIVTRHGGRVWAEAEVDHGAVFYFSLPRGKKK